jgi:hypothetical protein
MINQLDLPKSPESYIELDVLDRVSIRGEDGNVSGGIFECGNHIGHGCSAVSRRSPEIRTASVSPPAMPSSESESKENGLAPALL